MTEEESITFEEICNSVIEFITDIDTNIAIKEAIGIAPIEIASAIVKDRKEMKD